MRVHILIYRVETENSNIFCKFYYSDCELVTTNNCNLLTIGFNKIWYFSITIIIFYSITIKSVFFLILVNCWMVAGLYKFKGYGHEPFLCRIEG